MFLENTSRVQKRPLCEEMKSISSSCPDPDTPSEPEGESGHGSDMTMYVAIAAAVMLVESLAVMFLLRRY